jgi:hypothetical protein
VLKFPVLGRWCELLKTATTNENNTENNIIEKAMRGVLETAGLCPFSAAYSELYSPNPVLLPVW